MTNITKGKEGQTRSRLLNRIQKLANNSKNVVLSADKTRSILITTNLDGEFKTETVDFKNLLETVDNTDFFPGYFQSKVHTFSSLVFNLTPELYKKFESNYSNVTYLRSKVSETSKNSTLVVPLSQDIFDQETLNKLVNAINYQIGSKINISFETTAYNPTLQFIKIENASYSNGDRFLDVTNTIKRHKNQLQQSVGQKNIKKLEQLKEGLYIVNRFNNEAEASLKSSIKNVSFLQSPEPLKAPYTLGQVKEYSSRLEVAAQMALGLGIKEKYLKEVYKGQHTSTVFQCLIDDSSDAVVYINKNVESKFFGKLGYKSLKTGERFSMAELYSRLLSPDEDVNKPTLLALQMKLLDEIGLIQTPEADIDIPKDLTPKQVSVLHGFYQLLKLKQSVVGQEGDPILFTYSFASMWCGVSRITATNAIKKLVKANIIYIADQTKHLISYLFTKIKSITEIAEESLAQTQSVKNFISEDIKKKYRLSKGYKEPKNNLYKHNKSMSSIQEKLDINEERGGDKAKRGVRCNEYPFKDQLQTSNLIKKMLPQ